MNTLQEVFDEALKHLASMPHRAATGNRCHYRTPDGCKCVVGHFIPNDKYHPSMEGDGILFNREVFEATNLKYITHARDLLHALQHLHDNHNNWMPDKGFIAHRQAAMIAARFNLIHPLHEAV